MEIHWDYEAMLFVHSNSNNNAWISWLSIKLSRLRLPAGYKTKH